MPMGARVTLLENAAATGSAFQWPGGKGVFMAEATFGAGSVSLQMQSANSTWLAVSGAALTANGVVSIDLPMGQIRGAVAGGATAAYAYAVKTGQT